MSMSDCPYCWSTPCVCNYKERRISELEIILKAANKIIEEASKQTRIIEGDGESAFGCIDEKVPTELAKKAKEFLELYKF